MFNASTALAIEKECAADAISEIFSSVKAPFLPYVETVVRALLPGLKHGWHDGIRKSAAAALLNFISTFHEMSEAPKWTKGSSSVRPSLLVLFCAPLTMHTQPPLGANVAQLAGAILPDLFTMWADEEDR